METVNSITISVANEPEVLELINEYASLQHLRPTTALKQYLLQTLPAKIEAAKEQNIITNGAKCQG